MSRRKQFPELSEAGISDELFHSFPVEVWKKLYFHAGVEEEFSKEIDVFKKLLGFQDNAIESLFDELHYAVVGNRLKICCYPRPRASVGLKYVHASRDALLRLRYRSDSVKSILEESKLVYALQCYGDRRFPSGFCVNGGLNRKIMYEFFDFIVCCRTFLDRFSKFLLWSVGASTKHHYSKLKENLYKFESISGVSSLINLDKKYYLFKKFVTAVDESGYNVRNIIVHEDYIPFVNVSVGCDGLVARIDPEFVTEKNGGNPDLFFDELIEELVSYAREVSELMVVDWKSIAET